MILTLKTVATAVTRTMGMTMRTVVDDEGAMWFQNDVIGIKIVAVENVIARDCYDLQSRNEHNLLGGSEFQLSQTLHCPHRRR